MFNYLFLCIEKLDCLHLNEFFKLIVSMINIGVLVKLRLDKGH